MNNKEISKFLKDYSENFPNMPTRTLAKKIENEANLGLTTENIRGRLRYLKGLHPLNKKGYGNGATPLKSGKHSTTDEWSSSYDDESAVLQYKGSKSIQSKEDAIKHFNVDTKVWDVRKYEVNSWDVTMLVKTKDALVPKKVTNYQVKLFLTPKIGFFDLNQAKKDLSKYIVKRKKVKHKGEGVIVAGVTDLHIGSKSNSKKGLILTPDFDVDIVQESLLRAADRINEQKGSKVYLAITGDLVETITGLNHINSWQGIQEDFYGGNAIILAYEIIEKCLLSKINNLEEIFFVSGNHDRLTSDRKLDEKGSVAQLVSYMCSKTYKTIWHPMLISRIIDDVNYIFTHYHLRFVKQNLGEIFWKYGVQGKYNLLIGGHKHTREIKKPLIINETILKDGINYRAVTLAPIFTGNFYSESNGWTSSAGIGIFKKYQNNIDHLDLSI